MENMQLLTEDKIKQYEEFNSKHQKGHFTQTLQWAKVKDMWKNEVVLSLDDNGNIKGSMSLLIRKIPFFKSTIMYSPRGPVCDIYDKEKHHFVFDEGDFKYIVDDGVENDSYDKGIIVEHNGKVVMCQNREL